MSKRIYVLYLLDCLHMCVSRPGRHVLICTECNMPRHAIELREAAK